MIVAPPSDAGADHDTLSDVPVAPDATTLVGGLGTTIEVVPTALSRARLDWLAPVIPETRTGTLLSSLVSSPSSPLLLLPQHFALPSTNSAHVCVVPALTFRALEMPETSIGALLAVDDASPNSPLRFLPQQRTSPLAITAQVLLTPAFTLTAETLADVPVISATDTGTSLSVFDSSPNWPSMFAPQHLTVLFAINAHV